MGEALRDGRFVILGPLGEGAQARTFDGMDKREGRAVAIKRFDVRNARAWKDVELAEREARVLGSLAHPRLPAYVDHFEEEGALYLVMEKIDGESLASLRKRGRVLAEDDVLRLLRDAADVLGYLHGRAPPVIHRDLKPGNVIRRPDGSFAFVDFGAVRDKLRPEGGSTVVGTFGYMAPEQFQGRALPQSDVYAIAATALTMLTGEEPENLPHKGLAIDVRAALRGRASERLVTALESMLEPDPDRRPARVELPSAPAVEEPPRWRWHSGITDEIAEQFERRADDFERRARDYERRADRGGPSAKGYRNGADGYRKGADEWRKAAEKMASDVSDHVRRRARRHAEREERRAERRAARAEDRARGRAGRVVPWPIALMVTLALAAAIVAVSIATQIAVPLVLVLLSLFFGKPLREAARAVREAGGAATEAMRRSQRWIGGQLAPPREEEIARAREDERVRVAEPREAPTRARVADPTREAAEHDAAEHEAAEHEAAREEAKRRR